MAQAIYAALSYGFEIYLLGPFATNAPDVDTIRIRKTIYLPALFVGIFLERDLAPVDAWSRLNSAIVDAGAMVHCQTIIDLLFVALTRKSGEDQTSPLETPQPTAPLADGKLMRHHHQTLTHHLPRLNPLLQHVQGSLIAMHSREVAVEMRQDREEKAKVRE